MSCWATAHVAANSAVTAPTMAMTVPTLGTSARSGLMRHMRYTPAVTMVAAWMRADTGVGPSMASGSQTNRGPWALLPAAARYSSRAMAVAVPRARCGALDTAGRGGSVPGGGTNRDKAGVEPQ